MTDRAPYAEVKLVVEEFINSLFKGMEVTHGWTKDEFFANYKQEILAEADEETYDIIFSAPQMLQ